MNRRVKAYNRAAELVQSGWCRFHGAKNKNNKKVFYLSVEATKFCMTGALSRSFADLEIDESEFCRTDFDIEGLLFEWNDAEKRTQGEVVEVLRNAAKKAAKENMTYG